MHWPGAAVRRPTVSGYFAASGNGHIVLVETFGGERNYYFYVSEAVNVESVLHELRASFPGLKLEGGSRSDPAWKFIRRYTADILDAPASPSSNHR